jgi:hypothetical protein
MDFQQFHCVKGGGHAIFLEGTPSPGAAAAQNHSNYAKHYGAGTQEKIISLNGYSAPFGSFSQ